MFLSLVRETRISMDNNRLYCHLIASIYEVTQVIDYNPSKTD